MDHKGADRSNTFHTLLISRINSKRLGTRYVRRGLDKEGNAANNVEMEQIVFHHDYLKDKTITSFCQLRGSVPSIWGTFFNVYVSFFCKARIWICLIDLVLFLLILPRKLPGRQLQSIIKT